MQEDGCGRSLQGLGFGRLLCAFGIVWVQDFGVCGLSSVLSAVDCENSKPHNYPSSLNP